jgi:hypothetical protein
MRKAFDANAPKFRPRLKSSTAPEEPAAVEAASLPASVENEVSEGPPPPALAELPVPELPAGDGSEEKANGAADESTVPLALSVAREDPATSTSVTGEASMSLDSQLHAPAAGPAAADGHQAGVPTGEPRRTILFDESSDVQARRERLLQVKRKVAAAARPAPSMPALPETPARAGESALVLVRDLEVQLQRSRDVEGALRIELDQARAELARGAAESRRTAERLAAVEQQVEEKRGVLQEMLGEMSGLEEERDGAVGRAQALTALDEERQGLLDGLSARAEQAEKGRAEAQAEVDRIGDELDGRATDAARLRAALAQVTRERDDLARELAEARRERDELTDARKALEQVHEALATAHARLGS